MNRKTEQEQNARFVQHPPLGRRRLRNAQLAGLATLAAAGVLLAIAVIAPAQAQEAAPGADASPLHLTGNLGVVSQYVFRGTTQTNRKPALQGGFDLTHDNGLYAGLWMSNVSWISDTNSAASASLEADLYAGWKPALTDWLNADVGVLHYAYPGSYPAGMTKPDTNEIYAGLDAKWIAFKYSYSTGNTFGNAGTSGSSYADLSVNHELFAGINGIAHIGRQRYTGPNASALSYTDWKLGLTRDFYGYLLGLAYTDTNAADAGYTIRGKNIGRSQVVLSLNKTF
ncbi:TorF family putative porin [Herbaspirillum sp. LeCh32-8]|uniref:TorF family putative porin n=1 Tax=Herbaspirillum sp. LeCh32-8 TaxID=2821356 RepID=UPI001AE98D27|nr:TorF family putative porin [Herbaspirillum sp. LeCh32-8]MBP0597495.1 TorF family putative porin [Herbaspirillum sp. LeCh32-8]